MLSKHCAHYHHFGIILSSLWAHTVTTLGSCCHSIGLIIITLASYYHHFGLILSQHWAHVVTALGSLSSLWHHIIITLGTYCHNIGLMLSQHCAHYHHFYHHFGLILSQHWAYTVHIAALLSSYCWVCVAHNIVEKTFLQPNIL